MLRQVIAEDSKHLSNNEMEIFQHLMNSNTPKIHENFFNIQKVPRHGKAINKGFFSFRFAEGLQWFYFSLFLKLNSVT